MRFMVVVKGRETGETPPQALIDAINEFSTEARQAGVLVDVGGLLPTATGARVRLADGKVTVTDGPFSEAKEVIGGFTTYDVASKEEAMEWVRRFMELHLKHWPEWEGELELRPMYEEPPTE